jgi:RPA family protein
MFCSDCLIEYTLKHGDVKIEHPEIGIHVVHNLLHYRCDKCGDMVIMPEQTKVVENSLTKARVVHLLERTLARLNSQDIANELSIDILTVEKVLIELTNEEKIQHEDIKMRLGARRLFFVKPKTRWGKIKSFFKNKQNFY